MHLAQSVFLTNRPFSITVTFCKFGLNFRLVACWEKERLCPKVVVFPQLLHLAIFQILSLRRNFPCLESLAAALAMIPNICQLPKAWHFTIQRNHIQDKLLK
jgi:hypothetical protein